MLPFINIAAFAKKTLNSCDFLNSSENPVIFVRFLLAGSFSALINVISRYLLTPIIGFESSIVIAYIIGMVVAYFLFRTLVFSRTRRGVANESFRFVIVNIIALTLVWSVSVALARIIFPAIGWSWYAEDIAHLIGISVPTFSSFIGHSKYTFK